MRIYILYSKLYQKSDLDLPGQVGMQLTDVLVIIGRLLLEQLYVVSIIWFPIVVELQTPDEFEIVHAVTVALLEEHAEKDKHK